MPGHANSIVVGPVVSYFDVTIEGPLAEYMNSIALSIEDVYGVVEAKPLPTHQAIRVVYYLPGDETDAYAVRVRVRNRCRAFIDSTVGFKSTDGDEGSYADLSEDFVPISV